MRRTCLAAAIAALTMVAMPLSLWAQRTTRLVFVSATDAKGERVLNLTRADLEVTENGQPREITRVTRGNAPLRIVLLVDSSTSIDPYMARFREALQAFADTLPPEHEIAFISTGGQIRVRTPPSRDRLLLKTEISRFASGGGANAFLDSLIEADRRFLASAPGQWPVFAIVMTDKGENRREFELNRYNTFMNGFVARGGAAHAVILRGNAVGPVTDLTINLVENTGGLYGAINTDTTLPDRLVAMAKRITADHQQMDNAFEVEFIGDPRMVQPMVNITVKRDGVQLEMSARRPF